MPMPRPGYAAAIAGIGLVLFAAGACAPSPPPPPIAPATDLALVADVPDAEAAPVASDTKDAEDAGAGAEGSPLEVALREWLPHGKSQCRDYDYFPNGGLQNFWCHRPARVTLGAVRALAGVPLFSSGPHRDDELVLDAKNDFGHYNPEFVRWLVDVAGPSERDSAARRATQQAYDENAKPLAEVFYFTLSKIVAEPKCFAQEKQAYAALVRRKKLPVSYYERWYAFMSPKFCTKPMGPGAGSRASLLDDGGVSGNVVKTAVGFWIRRSLDGTMDAFAEGVTKVVTAYEPELIGAFPDRTKRRLPPEKLLRRW